MQEKTHVAPKWTKEQYLSVQSALFKEDIQQLNIKVLQTKVELKENWSNTKQREDFLKRWSKSDVELERKELLLTAQEDAVKVGTLYGLDNKTIEFIIPEIFEYPQTLSEEPDTLEKLVDELATREFEEGCPILAKLVLELT
jgi:hypothetical protein